MAGHTHQQESTLRAAGPSMQPQVHASPHREDGNLAARNSSNNDSKDQRKRFIVEAETVNTEAANILPSHMAAAATATTATTTNNTTASTTASDLNTMIDKETADNYNNLASMDNEIVPSLGAAAAGNTANHQVYAETPSQDNLPLDTPALTSIPKGSDIIEPSNAITRPPIINTSSKDSSSNSLIDNNPLPIPSHVTNITLKNKKSSLLVDSQDILNPIKNENKPLVIEKDTNNNLDSIVDEVIKESKSTNKDTIDLDHHANREGIFNINNNNNNNNNSLEMKDKINAKNKPRTFETRTVSKIIERPTIPSMNSRDYLLNNTKMGNDTRDNQINLKDKQPTNVFEINKIDDKPITPHEEIVPITSKQRQEAEDEIESPEDDTNDQKANKTDFFAARLATAVGENEISDSEEAFVYESAANSTKNLIYPNSSSTNQISDLRSTPYPPEVGESLNPNKTSSNNSNNNNYGISTKMSVPLLNTNKKLMNRLKNTRHTSTGGILSHSSIHGSTSHFQPSVKSHVSANNNAMVNATSNLNTETHPSNLLTSHTANITEPSMTNHENNTTSVNDSNLYPLSSTNNNNNNNTAVYGALQTDDLPSIRSVNNNIDRQNDIQSVRSFLEEQHLNRSPEKRKSTFSLNKLPPGGNSFVGSVQKQSLMKIGSTNTSLNQNSYNNNNDNGSNVVTNNNSNCGKKNGESKRVLRTTVSKIFDNNGTPLRGYSGFPDNVNLEDYIEQTDDLESLKYDSAGTHPNNNMNGNGIVPRLSNKDGYGDAFNDPKRLSSDSHATYNNSNVPPGSYYIHDTNPIKEEDEDDLNNSINNKAPISKNNNNNISKDDHPHNEDDIHSTFYYSHRTDLEARPQISDYEDDDIDPDADDGLYEDSGYYRPNSDMNQPHLPYHGKHNEQGNSNGNRNGGYYDYQYVNENTPLRHSARKRLSRNPLNFSPHDFSTKKSFFTRFKNIIYYMMLISMILAIGFSFGFILATNKELQDFDILLLDNVISSAEELIFDITAAAFNIGFFTITMDTIDLDVFAKSEPVLDTEALFLGTIDEMETPMKFAGGFFNRRYAVSTTALKIVSPGNSTLSDNMKWRKLIKYDYELVLRGTMKYTIPFFNSVHSVNVQKSAVISGRKGEHSNKPLALPIDLL